MHQQKEATEKRITKWNQAKENALKEIEKRMEDAKKKINEQLQTKLNVFMNQSHQVNEEIDRIEKCH